jgi:ParB family chromosome partitioning protein
MPALQMIPTNEIAAGEDNPRGVIDTKGKSFKELCASIEARGVLQPILVSPANGDGRFGVIAGYRRHAAAAALKLDEVPAMVMDLQGAELIAALTENIQREALSPVAEAEAIKRLREEHGFSQEQAAEALGKSVRWARDREKLVSLPAKAKEAFDKGAIPLEAGPEIAKIAEKAPKAAEALAVRAIRDSGPPASEEAETTALNLADKRDLVVAIEEAIEQEQGEASAAHFLYEVDWSIDLSDLERANVPDKFLAPLREGFEKLKSLDRWTRVRWDEAVIDQGRAFGCLLEIEAPGRYEPDRSTLRTYITDAAWLGEHALGALNATLEQVTKRTQRSTSRTAAESKPEKGSEAEKKAKEKKRKEREAELDHRDQVRSLNLELGQRAEKALRGAKLSLEEAKLLALLAVGGSEADIGGRGLVYCYHDYQEEEKLKNGRTKVTYAAGSSAGDDLVKAILAAKKPEEALAVAVRGFLLAANADQSCVAQSGRIWWEVPGHYGGGDVANLLEQIADNREVLPDAIRKDRAEKLRVKGEKAELALLLAVKTSRAKEGIKHDQLLAESRLMTAAVIDDAVDHKRIKAHETGELSYTITAVGTKRLEKLKAAEKERQAAK